MRIRKILAIAFGCAALFYAPLTPMAASAPDGAASEAEPREDVESLEFSLNYDSYSMKAGETLQLEADLSQDAEVSWKSDHEEIASVSGTGLVTARSGGRATVTATVSVQSGEETLTGQASCEILVENTISLDKRSLTLYTSQTGQLKATARPAADVRWESSEPGVAAVTQEGKVVPKKAGSAEITATANGVSASCQVKVKNPTLSLRSQATVYLKNPATLTAKAVPAADVAWKSSNRKIVSVSGGKLVPGKVGSATITATANGVQKKCRVTVKKPSLKFESKSILIFTKNEYDLGLTARPAGKASLKSSKPGVIKVTKDGKVTGLREGEAVITASLPGAKKATCTVTAVDSPYKLSRTSQVLMKGSSATIYLQNTDAGDSVSFSLSDSSSGVADIAYTGNSCQIKARKAGKVTVNAYVSVYVEGKWVTCKYSCKVRVINSGVVQQQASIAVNMSKALKLKNIEKSGASVRKTTWASSNPKVVSVGKSGIVKGKRPGAAKITATVSYSDGTTKPFRTDVRVSNPRLKSTYTILAVGKKQQIKLSGLTAFSAVKWKARNTSVASIGEDGVVRAGYSAGELKVTVTVDGKRLSHKIIVTNPRLVADFKALAPKTTTKIDFTGISKKSKISYKSTNPSVASVNRSGLVTASNYGNADIAVTADGMSMEFQANVAPQRAVNACQTGYSIINSSTYSQALRMSQGYYDCSSLVFRSYGCDSGLLGGSPSWAPTAASMAAYLEQKGKIISYGGLDASQLRPGDLIFYSQSTSNGRYRNIYHVSMYYGGGYRLEKPLRWYYPESNIAMIARPIP